MQDVPVICVKFYTKISLHPKPGVRIWPALSAMATPRVPSDNNPDAAGDDQVDNSRVVFLGLYFKSKFAK